MADARYVTSPEFPGFAAEVVREEGESLVVVLVGDDEERTIPAQGAESLNYWGFCCGCGQIACKAQVDY